MANWINKQTLNTWVIWPASSTDNAIVRFDGTTGKIIQNSSAFITDSGNLGVWMSNPTTPVWVTTTTADAIKIIWPLSERWVNLIGYYLAIWETWSSASTIIGNNVKASWTTNASVVRFKSSDPWNFIKMTYNNGISFHTNITSAFWTDIAEATNQRMVIDTSGNVGIGTNSPDALLTLNATGGATQRFQTAGTGIALIGAGDSTVTGGTSSQFGIRATNDLLFASGGATERMRITSSWNIGIWVSSFGNWVRVMAIANATTVPTTDPTWWGILYVESWALKYRGSSGTVTTIANA